MAKHPGMVQFNFNASEKGWINMPESMPSCSKQGEEIYQTLSLPTPNLPVRGYHWPHQSRNQSTREPLDSAHPGHDLGAHIGV